MATIIPLLNGGNIPLRRSGTIIARTAQLSAGDTGLGRALQGIGAQLEDMAQKEREADDARLMIEFEGDMRRAVDEQSVFQQQVQEQSEWLPAWQKRSADLQKRLDGLRVSDKTRLNLTQAFGQFADRHTLNIRGQAFEQSQTRAKLTFENRINKAVASGNTDEVRQTISIARQSGVGLPEQWDSVEIRALDQANGVQVESLKQQRATYIQAAAAGDAAAWEQVAKTNDQLFELGALDKKNYELATKQAVQGELQANILSQVNGSVGKVDISGARKMVEQYGILTDGMKEDLRKEIDSYEKKYGNEEILKAMDDLATGKLTAGAQFDSKYLRPAAVAEVRDAIDKARPPSPEDEVEMYLSGMKAIENLDPELIKRNDPEESLEFVKVAAAIRRAPAHVRDRMADSLRGKLSGGADVSANATAMRLARDTLGDILTAKKSDYFDTKDGRQVIKPAKVGDWIKEQARIMSMENDFEKRIKAIPNPTDKQYIETLNAVMGQDVTAARQRVYMPPVDSGFEPVPDRSPLRLDLPARSGSTAFPVKNPLLFGTP